jgi:membrane protein
MAPLLVVVIAVAALVYGKDAATGQLMWQIRGFVGTQGASAVQELIQSSYKPVAGTIATIISVATLLFAGSTVVIELQDALNTIWHVPHTACDSRMKGIVIMLKERLHAVLLIGGAGLVLLVSLFINTGITAIGEFVGSRLATPTILLQLEEFLVSILVVTCLFAAIYKVMPDVRLEWGDVMIGAGFTAVLFSIGKVIIALYLGKVGVSSTYGAAGSLVALLVWVYYSAQIFFMGAEFTRVYARRRGSHQLRAVTNETASYKRD